MNLLPEPVCSIYVLNICFPFLEQGIFTWIRWSESRYQDVSSIYCVEKDAVYVWSLLEEFLSEAFSKDLIRNRTATASASASHQSDHTLFGIRTDLIVSICKLLSKEASSVLYCKTGYNGVRWLRERPDSVLRFRRRGNRDRNSPGRQLGWKGQSAFPSIMN